MSTSLAVWTGALLSLAAYSFVAFGDNPVFNFTEHVLIGTAAGYAIGLGFKNLKDIAFVPLAQGSLILIVPILLGLLLYAKYFKKYAWLGRIPIALMVGLASGVSVRGSIQGDILDQIRATMVKPDSISNIFMIVGVVSVIWYFFLTYQVKGKTSSTISTVGRYFMMAAFGAAFASTVNSRFSLLISQWQFILYTWLGLGG